MNKNIIKITLITAIMFFGVFFTNIDSAKAAESCVCSFFGEDGGETIGQKENQQKRKTIYLVQFTVYKGQHTYTNSDIKYFGEATVSETDTGYAGTNTTEVKAMLTPNPSAKFMDKYNTGSFTSVVEKKCTKTACAGIDVTFHSYRMSKEIGLQVRRENLDGDGSHNADLFAISNDEAEVVKSSEYDIDGNGVITKTDFDGIEQWGDKGKDNEQYESGENNCAIIPIDLRDKLSQLFWAITIVGILLLIIMTAIEFIKVVTASEEDGLKGAFKHTVIRAICAIILLLLPMLINMVINIVNDNNFIKDENGKIVIGDSGDPLCKVAQ